MTTQRKKPVMTSLVMSAKVTQDRIERGMRIYESKLVRSIGNGTFVVASETSNLHYIVSPRGCTCPDAIERKMICKHAWAAFIGAALTVWRIHLATSKSEIEAIATIEHDHAPEGIKRTIKLESQKAIERLAT